TVLSLTIMLSLFGRSQENPMSHVTEKPLPDGGPLFARKPENADRRRKKNASPEEVRNLVEFLGLVLDNVYSGIIVCDINCRIVFMNQVYADLLKADRKQAVGKHIK